MLLLAEPGCQTKREYCIALFNRELHGLNCCPGNYQVAYGYGWFEVTYGWEETVKLRRPDLTAEADRLMAAGMHKVCYQPAWNTYVLHPRDQD